jgi:hypothetical protein
VTRIDELQPILTISMAAELAGMHPQTLRHYDRLGLVQPSRTAGQSRRYCLRDVAKLREVQRLSNEGLSLEGIRRVLDLEDAVVALKVGVLLLFLVAGFGFVRSSNYVPFIPDAKGPGEFGAGGILRGSSVVFFSCAWLRAALCV